MFELWAFPFFEILFLFSAAERVRFDVPDLGQSGPRPMPFIDGTVAGVRFREAGGNLFYPPFCHLYFLALIIAFLIDGYPLDGYYPSGAEISARGESFLSDYLSLPCLYFFLLS